MPVRDWPPNDKVLPVALVSESNLVAFELWWTHNCVLDDEGFRHKESASLLRRMERLAKWRILPQDIVNRMVKVAESDFAEWPEFNRWRDSSYASPKDEARTPSWRARKFSDLRGKMDSLAMYERQDGVAWDGPFLMNCALRYFESNLKMDIFDTSGDVLERLFDSLMANSLLRKSPRPTDICNQVATTLQVDVTDAELKALARRSLKATYRIFDTFGSWRRRNPGLPIEECKALLGVGAPDSMIDLRPDPRLDFDDEEEELARRWLLDDEYGSDAAQ